MTNKLGKYIKEYRESHGMSLREFAKKCGLSHAYINKLEKGIDPRNKKPVIPTMDTLEKIATATNVSLKDLLIKLDYINTDNNFDKIQKITSENMILGVGEYIKKLREEKNLSINQLALYSDVSAAHISRIERGLREPSPDILKKLATHLGVTYEELMKVAGYLDKTPKTKGTNIRNPEKELTPEEKYPEITDVEEAMKIILEQPGLMLNGELLTDEDKLILANSIQIGLRLAEERRRERKNKEKKD